ncbi:MULTISPECIES: cache domain-containing sensor histidine kinase [Cohnella]|uniref:cache domain-containing sensor histidine kinase n=1 Tax=Cohnella TaxID=329857 RepID=UPI00159484D2|nr:MULTISPECIES: sensor histidine kinase [Cohnella]MBN2982887.1 HAMP domain-containing protein [Cohnella algarum]
MLARLRPPAPLRFRSIQTKLTFWFSLVMLVTITSVGFVYYWTMIREIKAQALFLSENTVDQMNRSVGFFLDNAERLSLSIFGDPSVQRILRAKSGDSESDRQSDTNEMNYRLLSYASPWNQVQGIYVFSTDGRLYYASKEKSPRLHYKLAEEPWYGLIANGELKALEIWPSGPETTVFGKSETVFSLIRPINDFPVPSVLGYLKIDIKAQSLDYALGQEESGLRSFSHFYIADRNGHVIYDAEGAATGRAMPELAAYAGAGLRSGETEWAGERSLFVTRPVNGADWQMVAFVPYDSVVGKIKQTRNVTLLIAAAALLAVIVVSYMISTGITRPLRLLMRNMQKVEMGNFKVRLRPERNDEVGHLGQMFNEMVQNLDVLIKEAYESKLREKDTRLLALQAQINPHFLFNTLNMIKAIGRKREAPEIVGVVR